MSKSESQISKLFGENVQKFRKKNNFTQVELSEKLGVSQKHLSEIESGIKFPTVMVIEKLSKELNTTPALLFGGSDVYDISNKVSNLVIMNLQPKLNLIFEELKTIKNAMKTMKITIQTDDL